VETPITILYTYGLRGDLVILPRLFSFIRQLRAHFSTEPVKQCEDDPAPSLSRILLLDLGESCTPEVWHCEITGGRSVLVALDGMGYDAANVSGFTAPDLREKLGDNVRLAFVDEAHSWIWEGVKLALTPQPPLPRGEGEQNPASVSKPLVLADSVRTERGLGGEGFTISLTPADTTHIEGSTLYLQRVRAGQVGMAQIAPRPLLLLGQDVFDLPTMTQPDPTIAGIVDFILSEARYTQKRRGV
jgi:hypothetical protein